MDKKDLGQLLVLDPHRMLTSSQRERERQTDRQIECLPKDGKVAVGLLQRVLPLVAVESMPTLAIGGLA